MERGYGMPAWGRYLLSLTGFVVIVGSAFAAEKWLGLSAHLIIASSALFIALRTSADVGLK